MSGITSNAPADKLNFPVWTKRNTVADIPDAELVRRAVVSARSRNQRKSMKHPRWVAVMDVFGLGSTYAQQLCARFNLDPDELVAR